MVRSLRAELSGGGQFPPNSVCATPGAVRSGCPSLGSFSAGISRQEWFPHPSLPPTVSPRLNASGDRAAPVRDLPVGGPLAIVPAVAIPPQVVRDGRGASGDGAGSEPRTSRRVKLVR